MNYIQSRKIAYVLVAIVNIFPTPAIAIPVEKLGDGCIAGYLKRHLS
ncbi:MAG: hypothetical protein ACR9NN_08290 [Nostochopsis sp.]